LIQLLNAKRWNAVNAQQEVIPDSNTKNFVQAIRLLLEKEYAYSYSALSNLPDTSFHCQVLILKTDCLKELLVDSIDYYQDYQRAVDWIL
jgi:hypothetical protein